MLRLKLCLGLNSIILENNYIRVQPVSNITNYLTLGPFKLQRYISNTIIKRPIVNISQ